MTKWKVRVRGQIVGTFTVPSEDQARRTTYRLLRGMPKYHDLDLSEIEVEPTEENSNAS